MTTILIVPFVFLGLLLVCSGFFSSSETAYFSLDPMQLGRLKNVWGLITAEDVIELVVSRI